jgi:hypothetical protein
VRQRLFAAWPGFTVSLLVADWRSSPVLVPAWLVRYWFCGVSYYLLRSAALASQHLATG